MKHYYIDETYNFNYIINCNISCNVLLAATADDDIEFAPIF